MLGQQELQFDIFRIQLDDFLERLLCLVILFLFIRQSGPDQIETLVFGVGLYSGFQNGRRGIWMVLGLKGCLEQISRSLMRVFGDNLFQKVQGFLGLLLDRGQGSLQE